MKKSPIVPCVTSRGTNGAIPPTLRGLVSGCTFAAVVAASSFASAAPPQGAKDNSGEWKIEIRPREDSTAAVIVAPPAVADQPQPGFNAPVTAAPGVLAPRVTYAQAMASIPFNREEYEANPSYRHDAALEMMFGAMRPTMVVKQNIPYFSRYPDFFRNRFQIFPYTSGQGSQLNMFSNWSMNTYSY
jgi:hypothetical protein